MSTYFFVIFEVHYMVFRYNVYLEKYMDLSPRLINGTKSKDTKPMRRTQRSGSQRKLNNTLTCSSIQQNTKLATTLLLQRIQVFTILEASHI